MKIKIWICCSSTLFIKKIIYLANCFICWRNLIAINQIMFYINWYFVSVEFIHTTYNLYWISYLLANLNLPIHWQLLMRTTNEFNWFNNLRLNKMKLGSDVPSLRTENIGKTSKYCGSIIVNKPTRWQFSIDMLWQFSMDYWNKHMHTDIHTLPVKN